MNAFSFETIRGNFPCPHCDRTFTTRRGRTDHCRSHGDEAFSRAKGEMRSELSRLMLDEKQKQTAERERLAARERRQVVLSTDQIDEITAELESLIGMMEPYWSQGDADKDARNLIDRLNAMADGKPVNAPVPA